MQVTLKKGAALASALAAVPVDIPTSIVLSVYTDIGQVESKLTQALAERDTAIDATANRINCVYLIRAQIGAANKDAINGMLTTRAAIDAHLKLLNGIKSVKAPNLVAVEKQLAAMVESPKQEYGRSSVNLEMNLPFDLSSKIKALRKQRVKLEDEIAKLNFTTLITLSEGVVEVLRDNDLI